MNVKVLDLRGKTAAEAERVVHHLFGPGAPLTGTGRVLVLDSTELLLRHTVAYERLFTGNRVQSLVCLACGGLDGGAPGRPRLRLPGQLSPTPGVTTLWISDEIGVEWGLRPPMRPGAPPETTTGPASGVERLVTVLEQQEVFDRIIALGEELPDATAAPGLLLSGPEDRTGAIDSALARAIQRFTSSTPEDSRAGTSSGPRGDVLVDLMEGTHQPVTGAGDPGQGELARQENRARDEVLRTLGAFETMARLGGVASVSPEHVRDADLPAAGNAIRAYRNHVEGLIHRFGSLDEVEQERELGRPMVSDRGDGSEETDHALEWLRGRVSEELAKGSPITGVSQDLETIARRVSPRARGNDPGAHRIAPDEMIEALLDPGPAPRPSWASWLLFPAFVLPVLPALAGGWPGLVGFIVLVLAWVLAVVVGDQRLGGNHDGDLRLLAAHATAGFAGGFTGMWLHARFLPDPPPLPAPLLLTGALLLGMGMGAWLLNRVWASFMNRWKAESGLFEAERSIGELTALVDRFLKEEWHHRTERRRLADSARAKASAARAVAEGLNERLTTPARSTSHPAELESLLGEHLVGLADKVMSGLSSDLRAGVPAKEAYEGARTHAEDLIDRYFRYLETEGPHAPPPFPVRNRERKVHNEAQVEQVLKTLRFPGTGRMRQLSDPASLTSLRDSPREIREVRFAPRLLEDGVIAGKGGGDAHLSSVLWIEGGWTGVVRLVPLRSQVVEYLWDAPDDPVVERTEARETEPATEWPTGASDTWRAEEGFDVPEGSDGAAGRTRREEPTERILVAMAPDEDDVPEESEDEIAVVTAPREDYLR